MDESIKGSYAAQISIVSKQEGDVLIAHVAETCDDLEFIKLLEDINNNK